MKILINCTTGLGNIILFLPTYRIIKQKLPNAEFTILLDNRWEKDEFIRLQFGTESSFIFFPKKKEGQINRIIKIISLRKFKYDYIFRPYSGNSIKLAISILLFNSKKKIFYQTNSILDKLFSLTIPLVEEHYIFRNFHQLKILGEEVNSQNILEDLSVGWLNTVINYNNKSLIKKEGVLVGLHPGGNLEFNSSRMWATSKYILLIEKLLLLDMHVKIFIFGSGQSESKILENITSKISHPNVNKVLNKSLLEVSSIIKSCQLLIGNDSGIMNLAVGLGVPTLAILGPTNPTLTGPFGIQHKYVRLDLPCSPCFEKGLSEKCLHHNCLNKLEIDQVYSEATKMLKRYQCAN